MGSKNKPGAFDCYGKAEPDEPYFTLLGRDPAAWIVVRFWAALRDELDLLDEEKDQIMEAAKCAEDMREFAKSKGKEERCIEIGDIARRVARERADFEFEV